MHHIIAVFSKQRVATLVSFVSQARERYNQNLDAYIRLVLRRPLARVLVSRSLLDTPRCLSDALSSTGLLPRIGAASAHDSPDRGLPSLSLHQVSFASDTLRPTRQGSSQGHRRPLQASGQALRRCLDRQPFGRACPRAQDGVVGV